MVKKEQLETDPITAQIARDSSIGVHRGQSFVVRCLTFPIELCLDTWHALIVRVAANLDEPLNMVASNQHGFPHRNVS